MSIVLQRRVSDLEAKCAALEKKLAETAESLAYLHGHVLGMKDNPDLEPPEKLKRTLSLPDKHKN